MALAVALAGWFEYARLLEQTGVALFRITGAALTVLWLVCFYLDAGYLLWLPVSLIALFVAWMVSGQDFRGGADPIAYTLLGAVYVGGLLGFFLLLRALPQGAALIYFIFFVVWTGDAAGYFVGRALGRRRLAPKISPGKTVAGAVANTLGGVVGGLLAKLWFLDALSWGHGLLAALICGIIGQLGDLFESFLKRCAGAKDSGAWIPGHGGVLDRIDSLLFAAPAFYCYYRFLI